MKKLLKRILKAKGYIPVHPIQHNGKIAFDVEGLHYDFVSPLANFAPWKSDQPFIQAYNKIKKFTLVDIYRCYELWQLVEQSVSKNESCSILEVGVWRGGTAGIIAAKLLEMGKTPNLYLADTFSGVVKASLRDDFYKGDEHSDTNEEIVRELLDRQIKYEGYKILKGIFPDETANIISSTEQFSFCHIDVDVYASASDIIDWVWGRLVIGGLIVFDDYGFHWCTGITKLVDEQRVLPDRHVIHNLNGHAIIIKTRSFN